jgi:hypothetical protein
MSKTKFAIGCLVQWYEYDIIGEYIETLKEAIEEYDGEVIVDIILTLNQDLEKTSNDTFFKTLPGKFQEVIWDLEKTVKVNYTWTVNLYTIADYRREFNDKYCEQVDVLVWGESDMLVPKQAFVILDILHQQVKNQTPKYLGFFGTCKMWDDSWEVTEHTELTKLIRDPYAYGNTRYVMSKEEMNKINSKVEDLEIHNITKNYKFNGCGLIISSEIIKSGVNIPRSVFFTHEDTAFMNILNIILGNQNIPQYIIKNILLVHNREHPKKRMHIESEKGNDITAQRKSNNWYNIASEYSKYNAYNFNKQEKSYNWQNVWNNIK